MKPKWHHPLIVGSVLFGSVTAMVTGEVASAQKATPVRSYQTELFGHKYRLDNSQDLAAYIKVLQASMEKRDKEDGKGANSDTDEEAGTANHVSKKMRIAMQETHAVAVELSTATGDSRRELLDELYVMAGGIRASYMRVMPGDMDAFTAMMRENQLKHSPVGLGKEGRANNLAGAATDPGLQDPLFPSTYWNKPTDIAARDLYYGFDRTTLPSLEGEICTYKGPKTGYGTHAGFVISCSKYKKAKLKLGKEHSQPFAQRIFWALGFHTAPTDYMPVAKVKWDPDIFAEFNSRRDASFAIKLFGFIPIDVEHLQRYVDPFERLIEVIMTDEQGKEISVKPNPDWKAFKAQLYKDPDGHPETVENNLNEDFSGRIKYLVYRDINLELNDDTEDADSIYLGNWDWGGEGAQGMRETRAAAFISAWLNEFDPRVCNNKLYMVKKEGKRILKHYIYDVGVCLGRADDSTKMVVQDPNAFPWSFTRPSRPGETAIPLDGSYHPIQECEAFKAADIYDARWIAQSFAQLTEKQILEALVASGLSSAEVRLYFDKLVNRRNKALEDLGMRYPPLKRMDESQEFDYDPQTNGLITITTSQKETVTAPDKGMVVVKGRVYTREQVKAGVAARYQAQHTKRQEGASESP